MGHLTSIPKLSVPIATCLRLKPTARAACTSGQLGLGAFSFHKQAAPPSSSSARKTYTSAVSQRPRSSQTFYNTFLREQYHTAANKRPFRFWSAPPTSVIDKLVRGRTHRAPGGGGGRGWRRFEGRGARRGVRRRDPRDEGILRLPALCLLTSPDVLSGVAMHFRSWLRHPSERGFVSRCCPAIRIVSGLYLSFCRQDRKRETGSTRLSVPKLLLPFADITSECPWLLRLNPAYPLSPRAPARLI